MLPDEIFLINDGSFLLRMLAKRLEERGHPAWITDEPAKALEILKNHEFELVVVKLSEEDADRLAVLSTVKTVSPTTKLVVISDSEFLPIEVFETDFDDYISVPCSPAKLWRRLAVFLEEPLANQQRDLFLHPANYRVVHRLVTNLQEIHRNLLAGEAALRFLHEKAVQKYTHDWEANLEDANQQHSRSIFLVEKLLNNFAGHDFFQDQVDCYDI